MADSDLKKQSLAQDRDIFLYGIDPEVPDYFFGDPKELPRQVGFNSGNLLFTKAISLHTGANRVYGWDTSLDKINPRYRKCVIPCANFLGPHADFSWLLDRMKGFSGSVVAIGLGAQGGSESNIPDVPPGTAAWLRNVVRAKYSDHPNISLRGTFSLKVLDSIGLADHACVTGCPSNFISPDACLGDSIKSKLTNLFSRVGVASAHYKWTHLAAMERDLFRSVKESNGVYIMQSPDEMILAGASHDDLVPNDALDKMRAMCAPDVSTAEFRMLVRNYFRTYFSISDWMTEMTRCSLVIGARIHGTMAALQAGIPAICIAHDARTLELCKLMNVPHIGRADVNEGITKSRIEEALSIDWSSYDDRRAELLQIYYEFLTNNGITPSRHLSDLHARLVKPKHDTSSLAVAEASC